MEEKMMKEAQTEVRMNTQTVLSRIMRMISLISRTTLSLMINERYAIISVILSEEVLRTPSCLATKRGGNIGF